MTHFSVFSEIQVPLYVMVRNDCLSMFFVLIATLLKVCIRIQALTQGQSMSPRNIYP
jgi:hypothetical protein